MLRIIMKKYLFFSILFLIIIITGFILAIYLPKAAFSEKEVIFEIEKGEGSKDIAVNLEKEGLINWGPVFRVYVLLAKVSGKLQAGNYSLSPSMNIPEIAEKIVKGDVVKEKITIIEGWSLKDIGFYFENKGMFQAEELYDEMAGLEGYLFPDTYEIIKGATLEEIVKKMTDNFDEKLERELKDEIEKQGKTISEIIIMASLIEKEVRTKEEKELVSGILWKRLESGVPLQVDATISYITGNKTVKISKQDTQIDSPYNTYKYTGLPIGPICNPGLESIKTAIYPQTSSYWYYLSTPEGETIFSKTLEEHNIAKAKYLK